MEIIALVTLIIAFGAIGVWALLMVAMFGDVKWLQDKFDWVVLKYLRLTNR